MKYRKHSPAGVGPPFVDPSFAMELESARSGGRKPRRGDGARDDRKTKQLCRQVHQALSLALAGECDDDVLRDLTIESVTPAPNASRLMVCVALPPARSVDPAPAPRDVMERLSFHYAKLRHCVAVAITRKRAPELTFLPVAPGYLSAGTDDRGEVNP